MAALRALLPGLCLLAACGGAPLVHEQALEVGEGGGVVLHVGIGELFVTTAQQAAPSIRVEFSGEGLPEDAATAYAEGAQGTTIGPWPEGYQTKIHLCLPEGGRLVASIRQGGAQLEGALGEVKLTLHAGGISARLSTLEGGLLHSDRGDLDIEVSKEPPRSDLTCESTSGAVRLLLPAAFRGGVNLTGAAGKIEAQRHKQMLWFEGGSATELRGFCGMPLSPAERRARAWPSGVWVKALRGAVRFELAP